MWSRRDVLATLGVGSAQAILLACGGAGRSARGGRPEVSPQIHSWLRDAVSILAGAGFAAPHALAVRRHRTTAAIDVLGAGVARSTSDGVVLSIRDRDGSRREHVTNDLSQRGIAEAVRVLAGTGASSSRAKTVDFGFMPPIATAPGPDPMLLDDNTLLDRVAGFLARDRALSSRIVYSAGSLDIDDAHVWSLAPGSDLEQRLMRVRKSATRIAWNGTRPVVAEATRAWSGSLDAQDLGEADVTGASEAALALMTPRAFEDGDYTFALEPEVAASLIDAGVRALLTTAAVRRPEVSRRLAIAAPAPTFTLVDDPTAPGAYGGFRFDDEGELAAPITLIDQGKVVGRLADRAGLAAKLGRVAGRGRRAGHVGIVEPGPSHLRLAPGTADASTLVDEGFVLEGAQGVVVDPSSDRVVIAFARAREQRAGRATGRVFAELELVGELAKVLSAITAGSTQTRSIGLRDELDGQPRWRSIETPWLRGKGMLRARRSAT